MNTDRNANSRPRDMPSAPTMFGSGTSRFQTPGGFAAPTPPGLLSGRCYRNMSAAVVTRLAKGPAAEFAVFKISAKSGVVIVSENIRIIYHAPNDIQFAS